jgi:hypothetical protein
MADTCIEHANRAKATIRGVAPAIAAESNASASFYQELLQHVRNTFAKENKSLPSKP